jgi:hypothetical protein
MSKEKLIVEFSDEGFILFGIISDVKEFKLAWQINKLFGINLFMQDEAVVKFKNNKHLTVVYYLAEQEFYSIRLIKNLAVESLGLKSPYLMPEIKNFDYLLIVEGEDVNGFDEINFLEALKKASFVQYTSSIDIDKLKSLDNLIF